MLDRYSKPRFSEEDINFRELEEIGITRNDLEENGNMERLLNGEKSLPIDLSITMLGVDMDLTATLQLFRKDDKAMVQIVGLEQTEQY